VSWRAIFFLNLPVAAGAVAVTLFATHESRDETVERRVDFPGVVALSVGLTALVLALIEGNSWGWGSVEIVSLLLAAVVGLASFVAIEQRSRVPMVDFSFFRSPSFVGASAVGFVISFAMLAVFFFVTLYMQNILGYSALEAGVRSLPSTVLIIVTAPIAGRLADRVEPRNLIVVGMLLVAASLYIQTHITVHTGYGLLFGAFTVMGVGIGLTMSPMSTAAMNAVETTKAGVASGILSMSRMVGGTFGVAAIGALFQGLTRSDLEEKLGSVPEGEREELVEAAGSSGIGEIARQLDPEAARQIVAAVEESFIHALSTAMWLSFAVALVGAVVAALLIGRPVRSAASLSGGIRPRWPLTLRTSRR
jgi:EmrB/QacA subfamily drug resistance transporter